MAKKRKFFVDTDEAKKFLKQAYNLKTREVNYYHIQIFSE